MIHLPIVAAAQSAPTLRAVELSDHYTPIDSDDILLFVKMLCDLIPFAEMQICRSSKREATKLSKALNIFEAVVRNHAKLWMQVLELDEAHNGLIPSRPPKLTWDKRNLEIEIKAQSEFFQTEIKAMKIWICQMEKNGGHSPEADRRMM